MKRSHHSLSFADQMQDLKKSEKPDVATQCPENPKSAGKFLKESNFLKDPFVFNRSIKLKGVTGIFLKKQMDVK